MTNLQEVPTEELLSFQDYPAVHNPANNTTTSLAEAQINVSDDIYEQSPKLQALPEEKINLSGILSKL